MGSSDQRRAWGQLALRGAAVSPGGQRHLPVHDRDVRLLVIQQLLPQALSQQIHALMLHRPAVGGHREVGSGTCWPA